MAVGLSESINLIGTVPGFAESVKYGWPHFSPAAQSALRRGRVAAPGGLGAGEAGARGHHADAGGEGEGVGAQGGVLEVGQVELDSVVAGERGAALGLGPARDPGAGVEPVA